MNTTALLTVHDVNFVLAESCRHLVLAKFVGGCRFCAVRGVAQGLSTSHLKALNACAGVETCMVY